MRRLEIMFWSAGILLILTFLGAHAWGENERQRGITAFAAQQNSPEVQDHTVVASAPFLIGESTLASAELPKSPGDEVLAILRVAEIGLELPVRFGTEERVLRRGPGLIEGTSLPGSNGNVAIAAHRDVHFRGLKDLNLGDRIELESTGRIQTYIVTDLSVVDPADVHVLDETGQPVLTLVTCYPFYFVGNAPERFIVRAEAAEFFH